MLTACVIGGLTIRLDLLRQNFILSALAALIGVITPIALSFAALFAWFDFGEQNLPLSIFIRPILDFTVLPRLPGRLSYVGIRNPFAVAEIKAQARCATIKANTQTKTNKAHSVKAQ